MKYLSINIALAVIWTGLVGSFTIGGILAGFIFGYALLFIVFGRQEDARPYFRKFPGSIGFVFYYLRELVKANLIIAIDILRRHPRIRPGIVAIPLDANTDFEITLLANLITMTPGTLSLDISDDRKVLYIHAMYIDDPEEVRRETKEVLERKILELLRTNTRLARD
jgi:multicomponent Na+:H+ antiporter subunit E